MSPLVAVRTAPITLVRARSAVTAPAFAVRAGPDRRGALVTVCGEGREAQQSTDRSGAGIVFNEQPVPRAGKPAILRYSKSIGWPPGPSVLHFAFKDGPDFGSAIARGEQLMKTTLAAPRGHNPRGTAGWPAGAGEIQIATVDLPPGMSLQFVISDITEKYFDRPNLLIPQSIPPIALAYEGESHASGESYFYEINQPGVWVLEAHGRPHRLVCHEEHEALAHHAQEEHDHADHAVATVEKAVAELAAQAADDELEGTIDIELCEQVPCIPLDAD